MMVLRSGHGGWVIGTALVAIGLSTGVFTSPAVAQPCGLPAHYAGVAVAVEGLDPEWACRVQAIVDDYTTADKVGPIRLRLPSAVYDYFLDHPDVAAALVNRLDLGLYKADLQAPGRFWGTDGKGNQGVVQLLHREGMTRMYWLEGRHHRTVLPPIGGQAVVVLSAVPFAALDGSESVDAVVVAYLQLNNRFLAGVASLLRPLAGALVRRQIEQAIHAATGLSRAMRTEPDRVLFEATDPPSLPQDAIAFLRETLLDWHSAAGPTPAQAAP